MKKIILIIVLCAISLLRTSAQDTDKNLARVNKIQGIEVYFMSEPVRQYTVVFDENTGLKMTSLITGGLVTESVADKAAQFVKRTLKEAESQNVKVDAVIYTSGKKVIAVKFTDEATDQNRGMARVQKIDGTRIYVFSEPIAEYEVVSKKGGGFKMKSLVTGGLVNNSIEEDLKQFVTRIQKDCEDDHLQLDGVIYTTGKSAVGIKLKQ